MKSNEIPIAGNAVRIYPAVGANILFAIGSLAFVAVGLYIISDDSLFGWMETFAGWASIIFFGFCFFAYAWVIAGTLIRHIPTLTVHDDRLVIYGQVKGKTYTVRFAEVSEFEYFKLQSCQMIGVRYKEMALENKENDSSHGIQILGGFKFNEKGMITRFQVNNLTMKGPEICALLNRRLEH